VAVWIVSRELLFDTPARRALGVAEATRPLAREGRQDAITVLQATSSRLQDVALSQASH